jgi:exopolyphosphatase / guanosine-5'-triphosphate,3'-diphosphate pyrophosphatase
VTRDHHGNLPRVICACVDIGTNTTRVLVADVKDGRLSEVRQERAFTRIGMAPEIPREKIGEVARVVAEQVALARAAGAAAVRVVATAAIRAAVNRDEFLAGMTVDIEILDEDEEARMAFLGATETLGAPLEGDVAVVDVGGGSTEIAIGTLADGVRWSSSFLVGSGALADRYLRTDPPSLPELRAARDHAMDVLATRAFPAADCAVAVGGSAASLRTVVGDALDPRSLKRALGVLCGGPCSDVAERYSLDADRVRLLPAGILILDSAAQRLRRPLQIGRGGLREGILLDMARSL